MNFRILFFIVCLQVKLKCGLAKPQSVKYDTNDFTTCSYYNCTKGPSAAETRLCKKYECEIGGYDVVSTTITTTPTTISTIPTTLSTTPTTLSTTPTAISTTTATSTTRDSTFTTPIPIPENKTCRYKLKYLKRRLDTYGENTKLSWIPLCEENGIYYQKKQEQNINDVLWYVCVRPDGVPLSINGQQVSSQDQGTNCPDPNFHSLCVENVMKQLRLFKLSMEALDNLAPKTTELFTNAFAHLGDTSGKNLTSEILTTLNGLTKIILKLHNKAQGPQKINYEILSRNFDQVEKSVIACNQKDCNNANKNEKMDTMDKDTEGLLKLVKTSERISSNLWNNDSFIFQLYDNAIDKIRQNNDKTVIKTAVDGLIDKLNHGYKDIKPPKDNEAIKKYVEAKLLLEQLVLMTNKSQNSTLTDAIQATINRVKKANDSGSASRAKEVSAMIENEVLKSNEKLVKFLEQIGIQVNESNIMETRKALEKFNQELKDKFEDKSKNMDCLTKKKLVEEDYSRLGKDFGMNPNQHKWEPQCGDDGIRFKRKQKELVEGKIFYVCVDSQTGEPVRRNGVPVESIDSNIDCPDPEKLIQLVKMSEKISSDLWNNDNPIFQSYEKVIKKIRQNKDQAVINAAVEELIDKLNHAFNDIKPPKDNEAIKKYVEAKLLLEQLVLMTNKSQNATLSDVIQATIKRTKKTNDSGSASKAQEISAMIENDVLKSNETLVKFLEQIGIQVNDSNIIEARKALEKWNQELKDKFEDKPKFMDCLTMKNLVEEDYSRLGKDFGMRPNQQKWEPQCEGDGIRFKRKQVSLYEGESFFQCVDPESGAPVMLKGQHIISSDSNLDCPDNPDSTRTKTVKKTCQKRLDKIQSLIKEGRLPAGISWEPDCEPDGVHYKKRQKQLENGVWYYYCVDPITAFKRDIRKTDPNLDCSQTSS